MQMYCLMVKFQGIFLVIVHIDAVFALVMCNDCCFNLKVLCLSFF